MINFFNLIKKRTKLDLDSVHVSTSEYEKENLIEANQIFEKKRNNDVELTGGGDGWREGPELNNNYLDERDSEVIRVGFYVIYGSAFPAWPLVELMIRSSKAKFEIVIVASPDIMRGEANMLEQLSLIVEYFSKNDDIVVRSAYNHSTGEYKDCSHDLDFACIINPYESMTADVCRAEYLHARGVPTFFIHYTYSVSKFDLELYCQAHFKYFWRVYLSSALTRDEVILNGGRDDSLKVVGYPKLDEINYKNNSEINRPKKIIIAPHHTFGYKHVNIGAFEKFSLAYLELPKKYPHVNFIFRPHPLWKINLKEALGWTDEEINSFLNDLMANQNVSYSTQFNYTQLLNESDALIHDCGSFVAEYLHTSKPCCFMMNDVGVYRNFNSIGKICLDAHYQAMTVDDVFNFIDTVVLEGVDDMMADRDKVAKTYLLINQQPSSELIMDDILSSHFNNPRSFNLDANKTGFV